MKKHFQSVTGWLVVTLALVLSTPAQAEKNQFYAEGDIGGAVTVDTGLKEFFGPVAANSEVKFNPGVWLGLRGGYGVTDWFDAELETGLVANRISAVTGATETDGALTNIPLLLNARFHCPVWHKLSPYFGGGLGCSTTILSGDDLVINDTRLHGSIAGLVFAYQAFAGLRYAINDRMGLSVEYHYFAPSTCDLSASVTAGTASDRAQLDATATHAATIAFDYRF